MAFIDRKTTYTHKHICPECGKEYPGYMLVTGTWVAGRKTLGGCKEPTVLMCGSCVGRYFPPVRSLKPIKVLEEAVAAAIGEKIF